MRCRTARRVRLEAQLGLAAAAALEALASHRASCRDCAALEAAEQSLDAGLAALREERPVEVTVTARVLARIADVTPRPAVPATTAQLAWAAGTAAAFALGLLVGLAQLLPRVPGLAAEARLAATGIWVALGGVFSALEGLAGSLAVLVGRAVRSLTALAGPLESLQPLALATVALCSLMMATSITLVVVRDLRRTRWISQEPRT
jgi:hypothetical protein